MHSYLPATDIYRLHLAIAAAATESGAQLAILMGEIKYGLWQIGRLDNAAHLDGTFVLDELADKIE